MRYLLHESDHRFQPITIMNVERQQTTIFQGFLHTRTIIMKFISISVALLCCLLKAAYIK